MFLLKDKIKEQLALSPDVKIVRTIDNLLNFAVNAEAEEIYFEPQEKELIATFHTVRGTETIKLPKKSERAVLDSLKKMAGLKMPVDNLPDSGKFRKIFPGFKIVFSLAVYPAAAGAMAGEPGAAGEKIIISLKKEKCEMLSLGRLGLSGRLLETVKINLAAGSGLVLVVSDNDFARISTLYSFLNFINRPEISVATVEKDVIFDIPEINQSRLDPLSGFDSSLAVNTLRRQDADVVMISEIDDKETAAAAFNLASAGHFVLAGLNAGDISAGLSFLRDLSIPLPLLAKAAKMAVIVRSAERNCPYCLRAKKAGGEIVKQLAKKFSSRSWERLRREKIISEKISGWNDLVFYESQGCNRCGQTGRAGQIGIFEILEMTPPLKELMKGGHFSAVRAEAEKQDNYLLEEDALIKAVNGLIKLKEVLKI